MQKENKQARFPAPLISVLNALVKDVIPRWSKEALEQSWDQTPKPTAKDI
jgi:hypothetical protein